MKKILFTTAYSDASKNTWQYALRLAEHFGAQITLMHVYEEVKVPLVPGNDFLNEEMAQNLINVNQEKEKEQRSLLDEFVTANTGKKYDAVNFNFIVTSGDVAEAILQEEKEEDYDLIVLGTTTTSHISDALFGSTSQKVLAQADTPVFLVPPMASYLDFDRIVYATNYEAGDLAALEHLMEWIKAFHAKLLILHVYQKASEQPQAKKDMQKLEQAFEDQINTGEISTLLVEGNASQGIQKYLEQSGADMIAMTTHHRGFFARLFDASVTNQMAGESLVPLLIFKGD